MKTIKMDLERFGKELFNYTMGWLVLLLGEKKTLHTINEL